MLRPAQGSYRANNTQSTSSPQTSAHPSLDSVLSSLPASSSASRAFLIGGSQLYTQALTSNPPMVDRVLLTRILTDFECDTFLTDFTNPASNVAPSHASAPVTEAPPGTSSSSSTSTSGRWVKKTHEELCDWIGFKVEEEQEEKGVQYRYEMWVWET